MIWSTNAYTAVGGILTVGCSTVICYFVKEKEEDVQYVNQ